MKLLKISASIIAILGIVTVGGSWYTGKLIEDNFQDIVQIGNKQLEKLRLFNGMYATIHNVHYTRHFFTSEVSFDIDLTYHNQHYTIPSSSTIFHGPFPIENLKQFNFKPTLAKASIQSDTPEQLKPIIQNDSVFEAKINADYHQNIQSDITISEINDETNKFTTAQTQITYHQKSNNAYTAKVFVPEIDYQSSNNNVHIEEFTFNINGMASPNGEQFEFDNIPEYTAEITMKSYQNNDSIQLKDFSFNSKNTIQDKRIQPENTINTHLYWKNKQQQTSLDLGNVKFALEMDLDANITNKLMANLSSERENNELMLELFNKSPKIFIPTFSLTRNKEVLASNLKLFVNTGSSKPETFTDFLKTLEASNLAIHFNRSEIEKLIIDMEKYEEPSQKNITEQVKNNIQQLVEKAKMQNLIVGDDENMSLMLNIANGHLILNDKINLNEENINKLLSLLLN